MQQVCAVVDNLQIYLTIVNSKILQMKIQIKKLLEKRKLKINTQIFRNRGETKKIYVSNNLGARKLRKIWRSKIYIAKANIAPKEDFGVEFVVDSKFDPIQLPEPSKTMTAGKYFHKIEEIYRKLQRICPALINRKGPILLPKTLNYTSHNQRCRNCTN